MKRRLAWLTVICLSLLTLAAAPYSLAVQDPPAKPAEKTPEQIFKEADYFVKLELYKNEGGNINLLGWLSGILIYDEETKKHYIVTAAHFLNIDKGLNLISATLKNVPGFEVVKIVGYDRKCDVALLEFTNLRFAFKGSVAKLGDSSKAAIGDKVISIGCRLPEPEMVTGTVGREHHHPKEKEKLELIGHMSKINEAYVDYGYSGGPLINAWGDVIGMNIWKSNLKTPEGVYNVAWAVTSNLIKELLPDLKNGQKTEAEKSSP